MCLCFFNFSAATAQTKTEKPNKGSDKQRNTLGQGCPTFFHIEPNYNSCYSRRTVKKTFTLNLTLFSRFSSQKLGDLKTKVFTLNLSLVSRFSFQTHNNLQKKASFRDAARQNSESESGIK